jgi:4-hydroxy-tetrahydrodipicolinate synthase
MTKRPYGPVSTSAVSTYVISITPFGENGEFDEDAIRRHLRRIGAAGVGVYLGGGGSGEGYVLTPAEAQRLLEIGVDELKGIVPVRSMGVEPRTAAQMVDYVEMAATAGVDATQIYSLDQGHGHRPAGGEIQAYFDDILSAITLPAVISTHQSVGYQVPVEMLAGFVERYDHLVGINCSHQDLRYLADIVDAVGDRVEVHVGGPHLALTAWSIGANGFLTSEANLAPELCMAVVEAYRAGDTQAMTDRFGRLVRLSALLYGAGGIRATKAVLRSLGLAGGVPRRPQLPVADDVTKELIAAITDLGLLPLANV